MSVSHVGRAMAFLNRYKDQRRTVDREQVESPRERKRPAPAPAREEPESSGDDEEEKRIKQLYYEHKQARRSKVPVKGDADKAVAGKDDGLASVAAKGGSRDAPNSVPA